MDAKAKYLRDQLENAGGTAARLRELMLNTFEGQKQLLAGSLATLAIVTGEPFVQVFKPRVTSVVEVVLRASEPTAACTHSLQMERKVNLPPSAA